MRELCTAVILISSSLPIVAGTTWDETTNGGGDAGDVPGAEQSCDGNGALTDITGDLPAGTDFDLYEIFVPDMTLFSADTNVTPGTCTDTELYLFDANGLGIAFCDDPMSGGTMASLPVGDPLYSGLPPGDYLLAVCGYDNDPENGSGKLFPDTFPGVFGPTGPGGGSAYTLVTNTSSNTGTYDITLTGAEFVPNAAPTVVLSATTTFTGNATAGFDVSVVQGAALTNANLDLTDPDGDDIDLNSVTPTPSAITGVTAPAAAANNPDPTTISWTGTVSATQTPGVYTYTLDIDDDINPNVTVAVRITVTAAGGGGGGGGGPSGPGTRGGGGGSANIFAGCLASGASGRFALALLAAVMLLAAIRR